MKGFLSFTIFLLFIIETKAEDFILNYKNVDAKYCVEAYAEGKSFYPNSWQNNNDGSRIYIFDGYAYMIKFDTGWGKKRNMRGWLMRVSNCRRSEKIY